MDIREIESKIITQAATSLVEAGYYIQGFDGCFHTTKETQDVAAILDKCFATEESRIYVYCFPVDGEPTNDVANLLPCGWVQFIHGNGADVMADHTTNLDDVLSAASDLADSFQ